MKDDDSEEICTKNGYTKKEAATVLNTLSKGKLTYSTGKVKRVKIKHRPVRIYLCPICQMWHLTSRKNYSPN